ncbi:M20/M25/M40 family metallo-hydrolase [Terriglobus roseus]|uniref:Carboxypeptidase Q n=1 Tax=Terriglobus roseus TaxID=392734 RepID=A0A1H4ME61_9BACT|nr:M20/M25/M40 family metallo-hydrolase [Terriglobus roseus]SEB81381.1 Zn-dependent amino-or carboxypeptidase, M28 family [Terriglobus roseus]
MRSIRIAGVAACAACLLATSLFAQMGSGPAPTGMAGVPGPLAAKYKATADKILTAGMADDDGYKALTYLTDHIGNRITGSTRLNEATNWGAELMRRAGLQNVKVQPVMVPHWIRGNESAEIVGPVKKPLHMLGLGMSVGTPKGGITAPVVFFSDFKELDALGPDALKGKIALFNPGWKGYGVGSQYRTGSASKAAAHGAAAVLVRSATGLAMQTPHTGTLRYDPAVPTKIPAAALSVEDALLLERLIKEGQPVTVHLQMDARLEADVESANVMGEITGSEKPNEVVVLGGHIDSWDVGQGAQDDGGGIMATFEAVSLLHKLGLKPKRTVRVVFWVSEESNDSGGIAYRKMLGDKVSEHVAAIEMDGGAEKPLGMSYGGFGRRSAPGAAAPATSPEDQQSQAVMLDIVSLLGPIDAATLSPGGGGSDISPLTADAVPGLSPRTVGEHYFDWHHTEADTLDKVDPDSFKRNTSMLAVTAYILADMDGKLTGHKSRGE